LPAARLIVAHCLNDLQEQARKRERTRMESAIRTGRMMQEAIRLAEDGELGNSDAIRLLQIPHSPDDVRQVLARFEKQLTPEARSKLTLEVYAPLPAGVDNQRYEPIFDRYPITGKTYTTATGTVVPNEIQYYNGHMVQLYGECANVAQVREELAGSGYQPMILRKASGGETAIVQFWAHQLTDTSLRPYNAMFIIVAAVAEGTASGDAFIVDDESGVSAVLSMLDGRFDPARRIYENKARLYFARLLDSTRIAIDVGRERMGTDKRPGTIDLTSTGKRLTFSVKNGARHAVGRVHFTPTEDPMALRVDVAKAGAIAGIPIAALPSGTEYVYPGVARIGKDPVVNWEWRTDLVPRFQRVTADTALFDASSEEGAMLIEWGFKPKVLGYLSHVRGVVTGVPEKSSSHHPKIRIVGKESVVVLHSTRR
jgi:hypothetical protein